MNKRSSLYIASVFFLGLPLSSASAEPNKEIFDLELFSLSKHDESAFDAPAAVFIITAEDIRRIGAKNIPEALRLVPGLQVAQQGAAKWAVGSRGFNFQFTNDLLVLIDGRTVYTPQFSGTFWDAQDVILSDIDRIEVIRGPGATVWGANAVNGVINIITKNSSMTQGAHVEAMVDSHMDHLASARVGGKIDDNGYYRLYGKRSGGDSFDNVTGTDANDEWYLEQAGFRSDLNATKDDKITLQGEVKKGKLNNYFSRVPTLVAPFTTFEPYDKDYTGAHLLSKWNHQASATSKYFTQIYIDYDRNHIGIVDRDAVTTDVDFQHVLDVNERDQLTWGLGYRYIIDDIVADNRFLNYRKNKRSNALYSSFLQNKFAILPEELYLTTGSKFEHNPYTGFEAEPSIKLAYYPSEVQTIWGAVSRAVRTPSRGEWDGTLRLAGTGAGFVGRTFNDDYTSEKLIAYELGYRMRPVDNLVIEATAFYNDYNELRTFEPVISTFPDISLLTGIDNNGKGHTQGFEIDGKWQINPKWRMQASYSFLDMNLRLANGSVDNTFLLTEGQAPQQQFNIHSFYNLTPNIELDTGLYFVDQLPTSGPGGVDKIFNGNVRLGWHPNDQIELSLFAQNIFDAQQHEFQPSLYSSSETVPRTIYVRLSMDF